MTTDSLLELATIEQQITRNTAMRDSCVRFDAPAEAIATLTALNQELYARRAELIGTPADPEREYYKQVAREYLGH